MKKNPSSVEEFIFNLTKPEILKICEKEKDSPTLQFESYDHYCSRQIASCRHDIQKIVTFIQQGLEKVLSDFTARGDRQAIDELREKAEEFSRKISAQPDLASLNGLFSPEQTLASILGYSNELLEKIYQSGVRYYQSHQFSDASHVLAALNLLDPTFFSSWLSLGLALEKERKWEESLEALKVAFGLNDSDPIPHLHAAICYKHLSKREEADGEFNIASQLAKNQPDLYIADEIQRERLA